MAGRPEKHNVDYFPHDSRAGSGRTLTILFNHFGHEGISSWWLLLEELANSYDHFISITNKENLEFLAGKLHLLPEKLNLFLKKLADLDAIDNDLYLNKIIWSENLVQRLKPVYDSRKQPLPDKPAINSISLANNSINSREMPINTPDNTQSKGTKVKESKGTKGDAPSVKKQKDADPRVKQIFDEIRCYYHGKHPELNIEPIPNHAAEGMHLKKLLSRGFEPQDIFECWKAKTELRGGYCSFSFVNLDIEMWINNGKTFRKNNGDRHALNQRNITGSTSSGLRASLGKPTRGN